MFRHRLLVGLISAALVSTVGAGVAGAESSVTDGLLLVGTDAARARWAGDVDECHRFELGVVFVDADGLMSPLGSGAPRHPSDVEADLVVFEKAEIEGCGSDSLQLFGAEGISDPTQFSFVTLESASLDGFSLTVTDGDPTNPVTVILSIDIDWIADGPIATDNVMDKENRGKHQAGRRVEAVVTGTVTIERIDGPGGIASALDAKFDEPATVNVSTLDQIEGFITHYQEIQVSIP